jgi:hypothetical protein
MFLLEVGTVSEESRIMFLLEVGTVSEDVTSKR